LRRYNRSSMVREPEGGESRLPPVTWDPAPRLPRPTSAPFWFLAEIKTTVSLRRILRRVTFTGVRHAGIDGFRVRTNERFHRFRSPPRRQPSVRPYPLPFRSI